MTKRIMRFEFEFTPSGVTEVAAALDALRRAAAEKGDERPETMRLRLTVVADDGERFET